MTLYKNKYRVESTRLKNWDYTGEGCYYVTICTKDRKCLFGEIIDKEINLNKNGKILYDCWFDLPMHYRNIILNEFIIMPNHIHGIIQIVDTYDVVETGLKPVSTMKKHGLNEIIRALKTFSSRKINKIRNTPGIPVWQPGFYDHIVRNKNDLQRIQKYILTNPLNWQNDDLYL